MGARLHLGHRSNLHMGFHKRFITIDKLQRSFESDGYVAIKQLVSSPDAIVTCDDLSEKIVDVVIHGEHDDKDKSEIVSRLVELSYVVDKNQSDT